MGVPTIVFTNKEHFIKYLSKYILPKEKDKKNNSIINIDLNHGLTMGIKLFKDNNTKKLFATLVHYTLKFDGIPEQHAILKCSINLLEPEQYKDLVTFIEITLGFETFEYFQTT